MGLLIIVVIVCFILRLGNDAIVARSVRSMGWDEINRKHDANMRDLARKNNIYYNSVGHYFEKDRNYDGTPKCR